MDPQALAQVAATQQTNQGESFAVLVIVVTLFIVPVILIMMGSEVAKLKEHVRKLQQKEEQTNFLERKFDHLLGKVNNLDRDSSDLDKRFQYICSVTDRLARNESELAQRMDKVFETQMDTSLIALLNDGLIKELSKEDTPNPPTT